MEFVKYISSLQITFSDAKMNVVSCLESQDIQYLSIFTSVHLELQLQRLQ